MAWHLVPPQRSDLANQLDACPKTCSPVRRRPFVHFRRYCGLRDRPPKHSRWHFRSPRKAGWISDREMLRATSSLKEGEHEVRAVTPSIANRVYRAAPVAQGLIQEHGILGDASLVSPKSGHLIGDGAFSAEQQAPRSVCRGRSKPSPVAGFRFRSRQRQCESDGPCRRAPPVFKNKNNLFCEVGRRVDPGETLVRRSPSRTWSLCCVLRVKRHTGVECGGAFKVFAPSW
jgi:hypothetical protein